MKVITLNIRKGHSAFLKRPLISQIKKRIDALSPDVIFLQEVFGEKRNSGKAPASKEHVQHKYLAGELWPYFAYSQSNTSSAGHYGNAILSHYPIIQSHTLDISANKLESRSLLHCILQLPHTERRVHLICLHLGLLKQWRKRQFEKVFEYTRAHIPDDEALIVAGDFNDWQGHADDYFSSKLGLRESFYSDTGKRAKSFPARFPIFALDRIYVRHLDVKETAVLSGKKWAQITDHAALIADIDC